MPSFLSCGLQWELSLFARHREPRVSVCWVEGMVIEQQLTTTTTTTTVVGSALVSPGLLTHTHTYIHTHKVGFLWCPRSTYLVWVGLAWCLQAWDGVRQQLWPYKKGKNNVTWLGGLQISWLVKHPFGGETRCFQEEFEEVLCYQSPCLLWHWSFRELEEIV